MLSVPKMNSGLVVKECGTYCSLPCAGSGRPVRSNKQYARTFKIDYAHEGTIILTDASLLPTIYLTVLNCPDSPLNSIQSLFF